MSTRIHTYVPDELLARIDAALPDGMSRSHFIRRAIEQALATPERKPVTPLPPRAAPAMSSRPAVSPRVVDLSRQAKLNQAKDGK